MKARTFWSLLGVTLVSALVATPAHAKKHTTTKKHDTAKKSDKSKKGGESHKMKRLSISINGGIRPDMAGLGSTILQDGSIDTDDSTVASAVYGTGKALMSDRDNMTLAHNSGQTDSVANMLTDYQEGGSMLGAEFGAELRYELDDVVHFPMYIRAGFYKTNKMSGGEQSRTLGDAAAANGEVAVLLSSQGLDPDDYVGGTMKTTWDADWYEIPISIGIKVPVKRDYTFAYGSFGVSYFKGGFSVGMDVDENYANALNSHITASDDPNDYTGYSVTNLSPGAVKDTVVFRTSAIGLNYGLGLQVHAGKGIVIFAELNSSGAAKTVKSDGLKPETQQLLTGLSSDGLAGLDSEWFDNLAYPVLFGGATTRIGVRYYMF